MQHERKPGSAYLIEVAHDPWHPASQPPNPAMRPRWRRSPS
jgi:hypothetical protein